MNSYRVFEGFRKAGEKIKITILPGNHDYEVACFAEFGELFKVYNINVEQTPSIVRKIGGKSLWIEHGNYLDEYAYRFNRSAMDGAIFDNLLTRAVRLSTVPYKYNHRLSA